MTLVECRQLAICTSRQERAMEGMVFGPSASIGDRTMQVVFLAAEATLTSGRAGWSHNVEERREVLKRRFPMMVP